MEFVYSGMENSEVEITTLVIEGITKSLLFNRLDSDGVF
jgi:hypothetical protein